jgi:shikimate dehydrogenase
MIHLGLIGYPLSHSLSPKLHEAAFAALAIHGEYLLYLIAPGAIGELAELARHMHDGEIDGLNVTIPHKQAIIPLLDILTPSAEAIGAVNTLYLNNGKLIGHNTDAPGFLADQARFLRNSVIEKKALVLGAGGAARAVVYALLKDGWKVTLAVRRADLKQARVLIEALEPQTGSSSMDLVLLEAGDLERLGSRIQLIVNATPIGMFPETDISPWPNGLPFPKEAAVYDLVYNPRQTRLVKEAQAAGLRATTGLGMLVEQAALSFACWTGRDVPREVLYAAMEA